MESESLKPEQIFLLGRLTRMGDLGLDTDMEGESYIVIRTRLFPGYVEVPIQKIDRDERERRMWDLINQARDMGLISDSNDMRQPDIAGDDGSLVVSARGDEGIRCVLTQQAADFLRKHRDH